MKCFIFLGFCLAAVSCTVDLSFIHPCPIDDSECILESAKQVMPHIIKGIPEFGVPSFLPLHVDEAKTEANGFKIEFTNMEIHGLDKCELKEVKRPDPTKVYIVLHCPFKAIGDYKAKGKFVVENIDASNKFDIHSTKIIFTVTVTLKKFEKDGKTYYKIASFDYTYDPVDKVSIELKDLHNGDKDKEALSNVYLDTEWKSVMTVFGKDIITSLCTKVVTGFGGLFTHVSIDKLEKS